MAIVASDLEYRFSNPDASAGNQLAQAAPASSLGRWLATSVWYGGAANDLFANISGDDNASSVVDYVCLFIINKHATLTLQTTKLWLPTQVSGGAVIAIGLDPTAASALNSATAQAVSVTDANTPPAGVTFSAPTSKGSGLTVGDIPPGYCRAFWVRRTAANTAAVNDDGFGISFEGDTGA